MKISSLIFRRRPPSASGFEEEQTKAKHELAEAVVTLTRRTNSVTKIAQDAIASMNRGDGN